MIKKCDFTNCEKAGICRAPKSRDLKDYWHFCRNHAAEYNKNWNFYADMTPEQVESDWERQVFGAPLKDKKIAQKDNADYVNFINDFLTGRSRFDKAASEKSIPLKIKNALKIFELNPDAKWEDVAKKYRALAKKHHPDTAKDKESSHIKFAQVNDTYKLLESFYKK